MPAEKASTTPPWGRSGVTVAGTPSSPLVSTRRGGGPGSHMSPGDPVGSVPPKEGEFVSSENAGSQKFRWGAAAARGARSARSETSPTAEIDLMGTSHARRGGTTLRAREQRLLSRTGPYSPTERYRFPYDTRGGTGVPRIGSRAGSRAVAQRGDANGAERPGGAGLERPGGPRLGGEGPPLAGDAEEILPHDPIGGGEEEALRPGPLVEPVGVVRRGGDLDRGSGREGLPEIEIEEAPRRFLEGEEEIQRPGGVEVEDPDVGALSEREAEPVAVPGARLPDGGGGAPDARHSLRHDG